MARACQHCGRGTVGIHARGLCSLCYRDHREKYPKTKFHRAYTAAERALIRREWGRRSPTAIAAELGRKVCDVYAAAVRFGATAPRPMFRRMAPPDRRRLVRLHARGLSDREIGRAMGVSHSTAGRWLRRLGLASNCRTRPTDPFPPRWRAKAKKQAIDRIRRDGVEDACPFLRRYAAERAEALRLGWPQAGTLLEARILDALATAGPGTVVEIAARLGRRRNWTALVTRGLRSRGLLTVAGRRGRWCLYALAAGVAKAGPQRDRSEGRVPNWKRTAREPRTARCAVA